ncbi:MAG: hypothetical protein IJP31_12155 [Lachnospiraceae bacterium]|nr:hypothetical protein [Lachnospiraceae bacterium]
MKDNAVMANDGSAIYMDKITELADQYIFHELENDRRQEIYNNSSMFIAMICRNDKKHTRSLFCKRAGVFS